MRVEAHSFYGVDSQMCRAFYEIIDLRRQFYRIYELEVDFCGEADFSYWIAGLRSLCFKIVGPRSQLYRLSRWALWELEICILTQNQLAKKKVAKYRSTESIFYTIIDLRDFWYRVAAFRGYCWRRSPNIKGLKLNKNRKYFGFLQMF